MAPTIRTIKSRRRSSKANLIFSMHELYIPLRPKFVSAMTVDTSRRRAIHFTSPRGLESLTRIEGSRKAISTSDNTKMNRSSFETFFKTGVETQGGVLAFVTGRPLIDVNYDVFSELDVGGMRWLPATMMVGRIQDSRDRQIFEKIVILLKKAKEQEMMYIYDELDDEGEIPTDRSLEISTMSPSSGLTRTLKMNTAISIIHDASYNGNNSTVNKIVTNYIIRMNKIAEKVLKKFSHIFRNILHTGKTDAVQGSLSELIMNRIEIEHVFLSSLERSDPDDIWDGGDVDEIDPDNKGEMNSMFKQVTDWIEKGKLP